MVFGIRNRSNLEGGPLKTWSFLSYTLMLTLACYLIPWFGIFLVVLVVLTFLLAWLLVARVSQEEVLRVLEYDTWRSAVSLAGDIQLLKVAAGKSRRRGNPYQLGQILKILEQKKLIESRDAGREKEYRLATPKVDMVM